MSIAAFIDVPVTQQDLAVELAIALAEFSMERNQKLFFLSDAVTALEIGISLLGQRKSRSVEGGDFQASPIVLLPFISRPNLSEDRIFGIREDDNAGGGIDELYDLGLFAKPEEAAIDFELGQESFSSLVTTIFRAKPRHIIGIGESSDLWQAVIVGVTEAGMRYVPSSPMIEGFGNPDHLARFEKPVIVRPDRNRVVRPESDFTGEDKILESIRYEAERDGALVAGFFEFLDRYAKFED